MTVSGPASQGSVNKRIRTSWFVDEELIRRVRGEAGLSGRTQSLIVMEAIKDYLARQGTQTPPRPRPSEKAASA